MPAAMSSLPGRGLEWQAPSNNVVANRGRTKIWDLGANLHCSIVGTCLTTSELRHIISGLDVTDMDRADDHKVHGLAVSLAGRSQGGGKLIQKALDRRHESAIKKFAAAKSIDQVSTMWREALANGEIPGAYWAVLTHPLSDDSLVKKVFGEVHMLSHLVGAANRADIKRLRELEEANAELQGRIARAEGKLKDGFAARDETIRKLNGLLASQSNAAPDARAEARQDDSAGEAAFKELSLRLARETLRRERAEARIEVLSERVQKSEQFAGRTAAERDALRAQLDSIAAQVEGQDSSDSEPPVIQLDLKNISALYVGGRPNQIPQLRAATEESHGRFVHHDGGIEHSLTHLPDMVRQADVVFFPVDCVSHAATTIIKKSCQGKVGKYVPLRSSSLSCLLSSFAEMNFEKQLADNI